jgi:membrane fusion protein (multidrug efflux system)
MVPTMTSNTFFIRPFLLRLLIASTAFYSAILAPHQALAEGPAVLVSRIQEQTLAPHYDFVGRVAATEKVDIISRVAGVLEQREFIEGARVEKGQVLFEIEKAPYLIKLKQHQANLAGAKASLKQATAELKRTRLLRQNKASSEAELEVVEAKRDQIKAQVLQAQAMLEQAELELSYTTVRSPISGIIGKALYSPGNFIKANEKVLATIVQTDPVYVEISISDKSLLELRREGPIDAAKATPILLLSDGNRYSETGSFNFFNPEVDPQTDSVNIRSTFANPGGVLLPGQFVTVQVHPNHVVPVIAVAQTAIQRDRDGSFVMVLEDDQTVSQRRVSLGEQIQGQWVVLSGLNAGERVVIEGLQKIRPGQSVTASEE